MQKSSGKANYQTASELDRLLREQNDEIETEKRVTSPRAEHGVIQRAVASGVADTTSERLSI